MPKPFTQKKRELPKHSHSGIRRIFTLNIGTIVFGILFIYILISIFLYMTSNHVRSYRVTSGPLARNSVYTGVALYHERIITTDATGYVDYYARDHSKVKSGGIVYSVSAARAQTVKEQPGAEALRMIHTDCEKFAQTFSPADFHDVYSLKYLIEGDLLNNELNARIGNGVTSTSLTLGNTTVCVSPADGIVCYSTDGYEEIDARDISAGVFDEKAYHLTSLKSGRYIQAGDPVYRLIDSEEWSLCIPLTARQIVRMDNSSSVRVKFLKDGVTQNASFTILTLADGSYCGKLDFSSGLIRYLDSRFIDVELVTNSAVGLKIPVSSIVTKTFFTIPDEYATYGGNKSNTGFMKSITDKNGNTSTVFVTPTIYDHSDGKYYVDEKSFHDGDIVVRDGSTDRYIIRDEAVLEGVYCMNKGYAVFRKIIILDKNEDFCIISKETPYGISQFDNIVENSASVKESQITAQ